MRPEPKKRVNVNAGQNPMANLGSAIDRTVLPDLPEAETTSPVPEQPVSLWKPGRVVLRRETAHRGGKVVTLVDDFATHLPISFIEELARKLRAACGCGGTTKNRRIGVQGDQAFHALQVFEPFALRLGPMVGYARADIELRSAVRTFSCHEACQRIGS